ncbi:peptidylprolyl isomerase [Glycomyces tenuis]|uniref:peptidylprolyl isomerase n=1 Tax=Glycomyces tenuis TaxID=58116 RepID=UPI0003F65767|nr:peptidylprolyl isomerase [Glycomyces tenuis]
MASKQSQRMAARQQLQQRMAEKAERERKQRTVWWSIGGVGALVVLGLLAWVAFTVFAPDEESDSASDDTASTAPSEEESPATVPDGVPVEPVIIDSMTMSEPESGETAECAYTPTTGTETPPAEQPASGVQEMTIETGLGTITAEIDTANAPCTAGSFTYLAGQGYFDGSQCHRLTTEGIFVLQCGDPDARAALESGNPQGAGMGGPGYQMAEENLPEEAENNYPAGTLAMANAGAGTTGSQFFLVYEDTSLPADYTILGQITSGLEVVQEVAAAGAM